MNRIAMKNPQIPWAARFLCLAFCLMLPAGTLWPLGRRDLPQGEVTVTGRVRLVGTAAFNDLVISDEEGRNWYVEGEDRKKLAMMEQRQVTVRGRAENEDIILADGTKAGVRLILRDITLIE
ncbi:MAG: hypothetical protein LBQ67_05600 [Treponema sp.]|jgi:hypothetical protein|nr:hypothetical protein [Treponema sp.]